MRPPTKNMRQLWNWVVKGPGFDNVMSKLELVSASEGACVCKFKVSKEHTNAGDTLHGGMTATIVDGVSTMAQLATAPHTPGLSVDLSVSYLRAAKLGEEITVSASALKSGKTLSFLTVDLHDSQGRLVAQGKHTKFIGGVDS